MEIYSSFLCIWGDGSKKSKIEPCGAKGSILSGRVIDKCLIFGRDGPRGIRARRLVTKKTAGAEEHLVPDRTRHGPLAQGIIVHCDAVDYDTSVFPRPSRPVLASTSVHGRPSEPKVS